MVVPSPASKKSSSEYYSSPCSRTSSSPAPDRDEYLSSGTSGMSSFSSGSDIDSSTSGQDGGSSTIEKIVILEQQMVG
jgi:hypothetical protein